MNLDSGKLFDYKIKDFKYWSLFLHKKQNYLGRCILYCNRADAIDLTQATEEERAELFDILGRLKLALSGLFRPDLFNYAFLGNIVRHLHGHIIPRYSESREYAGIVFTDPRWGQNYQTDNNFIVSDEILRNITVDIQSKLKH